jgi:hypothetical protein
MYVRDRPSRDMLLSLVWCFYWKMDSVLGTGSSQSVLRRGRRQRDLATSATTCRVTKVHVHDGAARRGVGSDKEAGSGRVAVSQLWAQKLPVDDERTAIPK